MKYLVIVLISLFTSDLFSQAGKTPAAGQVSSAEGIDSKIGKLGVALYTFHSFTFPEAIAKVRATGLAYAEGFSFQNAGPEYNNIAIMNLPDAEQEKVSRQLEDLGIKMRSMYIVGDNTIGSWKSQFEMAKRFRLEFVTGEPPLHMLDAIDSLAGLYTIKLAIHQHYKGISPYWHPDSVLAALSNHPNFGVCADLGHWPKSGINPVDGLKKLAGHVISIHLKDIAAYNNPKLEDVPLGTGIVDFPGVFRELKRQKFKGYIYIERDAEDRPDNLSSVLSAIRYYRARTGSL